MLKIAARSYAQISRSKPRIVINGSLWKDRSPTSIVQPVSFEGQIPISPLSETVFNVRFYRKKVATRLHRFHRASITQWQENHRVFGSEEDCPRSNVDIAQTILLRKVYQYVCGPRSPGRGTQAIQRGTHRGTYPLYFRHKPSTAGLGQRTREGPKYHENNRKDVDTKARYLGRRTTRCPAFQPHFGPEVQSLGGDGQLLRRLVEEEGLRLEARPSSLCHHDSWLRVG